MSNHSQIFSYFILLTILDLEKQNRKKDFQTGRPSLDQSLKQTIEFPVLEMSEQDEDQVKIEDQGDFFVNESSRSLSEELSIRKGESKKNHLFYMDNIHEDHQELSNYKDNDYMKFHTNQPNAKEELRLLFIDSHKTLSYNSSKGNVEIVMDGSNLVSSKGRTSDMSLDYFNENIDGNMLSTFIVRDSSS